MLARSRRPAVAGAIAATIGLGSLSVGQACTSCSAPKELLTRITFGPSGFQAGHGSATRSMQGTAIALTPAARKVATSASASGCARVITQRGATVGRYQATDRR